MSSINVNAAWVRFFMARTIRARWREPPGFPIAGSM
jgi:hypothetical protein